MAIEFSEALKIVTEGIKNDPELRYGYQSNIAMAYVDADAKYNGSELIEVVANEAADNFLNNWCK